jgi:streptogramin lyase
MNLERVAIDPRKDRVVARIPDVDPASLAVANGSVWAATYTGAAVSRIDARTLAVQTIPVGAPAGDIAAAGRAVWAGAGRDKIWRLVPATNSVERSVLVAPGVDSIAGDDRSIWVASGGGPVTPPRIARIDAHTYAVERIDIPRPVQNLVLAEGRVWATVN